MKNYQAFARSIGLGAMLVLAACASQNRVESNLHIKGAPDWVNQGTNILKTNNGRLFHGVGSAEAMDAGYQDLQTSTADNRARAELARVLSSYMEVVSKDYAAKADAGRDAAYESSVSRQIDNVTRVNLAGSRIIGRWRDPKTNVIYSLAELDMGKVQEITKGVKDMNEGLRDYLRREGNNIFDRMVEEKR
jgi:hypothetical protein